MIIGIPKETQHQERRVGLTPAGVYGLIQDGHRVIVQDDAGIDCGFVNEDYQAVGGEIVFNAEEVLKRAELVVKVMPLTADEATKLPQGVIVFSFFGMAVAERAAAKILHENTVTAIGYDLLERADGKLPVLTAMSEIAGMMAPHAAARFLESPGGGRGILLGGIAGIPSANVVIIGAGTVGSTAAGSFHGAGAHVILMDNNLDRLRRIESQSFKMISTATANPYNIDRYVRFADVVVGAIFIHGKRTPHVVFENQVKSMKKGALIMDISIDQGGCVETSRPTSHRDPVFEKYGVFHYCVPNMPSAVARTASHALNNVVLPYVQAVARDGRPAAWRESVELKTGTYFFEGQCTNDAVADLWGMSRVELATLVQ